MLESLQLAGSLKRNNERTIKRRALMSDEEADALTDSLERKWDTKRTRSFVDRMEHKMYRKERQIGR